MGLGPIPFSALNSFAMRCGLTCDEFDQFRVIIRAMDGEYLSKQNAKPTDPKVRDQVPVTDAVGVSNLLKRLSKPTAAKPSDEGRPTDG